MKKRKCAGLFAISVAMATQAFAMDYTQVTNDLGKRIAPGVYSGKNCGLKIEFSPASPQSSGGYFEARIGNDIFLMEPSLHVEATNVELGASGNIVIQSAYSTFDEYLPPISWGNKELQNDFHAEFDGAGKLSKVTITVGHEHQAFGIVTVSTSTCEFN